MNGLPRDLTRSSSKLRLAACSHLYIGGVEPIRRYGRQLSRLSYARYDECPAKWPPDLVASLDARPHLIAPLLLNLLVAIAIFRFETVTALDIAVAVFYVAVGVLVLDLPEHEGVHSLAAGCMLLTVLSFAI